MYSEQTVTLNSGKPLDGRGEAVAERQRYGVDDMMLRPNPRPQVVDVDRVRHSINRIRHGCFGCVHQAAVSRRGTCRDAGAVQRA